MADEALIRFRLDRQSGLPTYRQLVEQVRQSLRLGFLKPGDRLPTVRDVVEQLAINPNTVHRAYRELEHQGLVEGQTGRGTFVVASLPGPTPAHRDLARRLAAWWREAAAAGLDPEGIEALVAQVRSEAEEEGA